MPPVAGGQNPGMRLGTYDDGDRRRAAVAVGDELVDADVAARRAGLTGADGWSSVRAIIAQPREDLARLEEAAAALARDGDRETVRAREATRLGPPVPDPQKIICIGLNYRAHAAEASLEEASVPTVFAKWANALVGEGAPIELREPYVDDLDYEAEVAVVIGRRVRDIAESDALDAIAGWMPLNDVSARGLQIQTSQWTAGKAMDGSAPCGPFLVLDDALREGGLELESRINGEQMQHAHTDAMIFPVAKLVAFVSSWATLEPGDIIATGTPEGVGMHRDPPRYLRDGDTVEIRVGSEVLRNPVVRVRPRG